MRATRARPSPITFTTPGALYAMIPPRTMRACGRGLEQGLTGCEGDHFEQLDQRRMVLDGSPHSDEARAGTARRWAAAPT